MHRVILLLGLLLVPLAPAVAGDLTGRPALEAVGARLGSEALLRAEFRQERRMRALSRPVLSVGTMVLARDQGVLWQVREPFPVEIALTRDALVEREPGLPPRRVPLQTLPVFRTFADLFLELLAGRPHALAGRFEARLEETAQAWRLTLLPVDPSLAGIATVEVRGRGLIDRIEIVERGGDATVLTFSEHRPDAGGLTAEERERLGG